VEGHHQCSNERQCLWGRLPRDGSYDFVIRELGVWDAPIGGWEAFERDFASTRDGKTM